jgi:hypothetical protein
MSGIPNPSVIYFCILIFNQTEAQNISLFIPKSGVGNHLQHVLKIINFHFHIVNLRLFTVDWLYQEFTICITNSS